MTISKKQLAARARGIKILLFDVDGILTDGRVRILGNGEEIYTFNVYDGYGIKLWIRAGFVTGFITGRGAAPVKYRAKKLGVKYLYQNSGDKLSIAEEICRLEHVDLSEVAYVGDDLQDLALLRAVGFPIAVVNAVPEVKRAVRYVTKRAGGDGAGREIIELLLKAKGLWEAIASQDRLLS